MSVELRNDDVVTMDVDCSFTESKTSKVEDIMDSIKDLLNKSDSPIDDWLEGIECEVLQAQEGGGWQKGVIKISVKLEFVPNDPPPKPIEDLTKTKFTYG